MATRFELVLHGDDPVRLRAAGEEALREIERLDAQLSLYRPDSEVCWINARAAREPIKVEPRLFRLLQRCADVTARTDGAFDITITPLMRAWGFVGGAGKTPYPAELESSGALVGMERIRLDEGNFTVQFDKGGVEIDLGGVGKGYAVERAVGVLRDSGITSALLHGGTSTICAIGTQPDGAPWKVAIRKPGDQEPPMEVVGLCDNCLSVSAAHGKSFTDGNREFGHVIDPRTGQSVQGALMAAVIGPSPTECDALSTALLVLGEPGLRMLAERFPGCSGLVIARTPEGGNLHKTDDLR